MVYIEKLVCRGFKSFGRDTVTIRLDPHFTCIVGPNGSGKSNVVDAILFVLGQLSAKTMRANVFSDLLYTPPKPDMPPRAKSALVELHFNNKDRKIQIDADKVVIERELDDTGKSVCRVNGKSVTRQQLLDLLGTIGVDPNGYNLVLQGETAQMIKMSPLERRKLIEEIAGIAAYDEQKERALKKLAESEANLGKVEAQLQERRRQLEKLESDRADALRYENLRQQIQQIRVKKLAWTIIKSNSRINTIEKTLVEKNEALTRTAEELRRVEQEIANREREIEEIDREIDHITGGDATRVSEQYGIVSAAVDHARAELLQAEKEYETAIHERENSSIELQRLTDEIEKFRAQMAEKSTDLATIEREISEVAAQIAHRESRLQQEQESYYATQQRLQALNKSMQLLDEDISDVRSEIKTDEKELRLAYEELRDAEEGAKKSGEEIQSLSQTLPTKQAELRQIETLEQSRRAELDDVIRQLTTVNDQVENSTRLLNTTREELIKIKARQDAFKEAEEAFLKRERAVARILEARDSGEIRGIYGTVSELGTIDPEYAIALEVAGGNRLGYIVVENEEIATQCVDLLKRERVGRASFIPLNRIKAKIPDHLPDDERVIGYALDLVTYEQRFQPAFEFVFADTIVTEDFETAKRMGFKGWRAVSLDGDLVERSGLITGGHYLRTRSGLTLKIEDDSASLAEKLKGLEKIHAELCTQQSQLRNREKALEREIQDLSKEVYKRRLELQALEDRLKDRDLRVNTLRSRVEQLKDKISALQERIGQLQARDRELTEQRQKILDERDSLNESLVKSPASRISQELKDLREVLEHHKRKREEHSRETTSLRVAIEERLMPKLRDTKQRIEEIEESIPSHEERVQACRTRLLEREREFEQLKTERERLEETVRDRRTRQIQLKEDLKRLRTGMDQLKEEQTSDEKAIYRLQMEQSRLTSDVVGLKAELATLADTEAELARYSQDREPSYSEIEQLEEKIRDLQREIDVLGAVNLKALTDYDAERERYDEIVDKKARLEQEHKEILTFMEELEREKTNKFLQVYNEIADNFAKVFAKLSPGGEGTLMLENPEHPLMGGVTVRSKPRGKEVVTLDAMSGGEKTLTGLAFIFAIQMHSPASFYVFDEIDAALDEVNAHNVATLISEMSKSSQFILVTLRTVTMAKADLLIGVTSQDGISKVVPVDLQQVASTA